MDYRKINMDYLDAAVELAAGEYRVKKSSKRDFPDKDYREEIRRMLTRIFKDGYGVLALENGELKGFMSFISPIPEMFGRVKGAFAPMGACYFGFEDPGYMASRMFEYVSDNMVKEGILSFGISIDTENKALMNSFFLNGFGGRCADGIQRTDEPLDIEINRDYKYEEIHYSEAGCLLSLKNGLEKHMNNSPVYMPNGQLTYEEFMEECNEEKSRFFIAKDEDEVVGYIELRDEGETFVTLSEGYKHIGPTFLKPEHRGKNIIQSLISFVLETLKNEGIDYLGVDCETINPGAIKFWEKYFNIYTYSVARRIDERIIE